MFVPYSSIWKFDRGKLAILSVFMEYNLLKTVVKSHSQSTKVVRKIRSELDKIRILPEIPSFSSTIFKKAYFSAKALEVCRTLCRVLEKRVKKNSYT